MPAGDRDHIGCFTDQVKLTWALVQDLDEAIKEVNLLGEHEEESSQKITELEVVCKRLRDDGQWLREERTWCVTGSWSSRRRIDLQITSCRTAG
jgi:hypothetical protein